MRKLMLIPLLFALPASVTAQRMGFPHFSGHRSGFRNAGFHRDGLARSGYYGLPLYDPTLPLYDPFYPGYSDSVSTYSAPAAPPVVVVQPMTAATEPPSQAVQPLMIELQGDRYVQIGGESASQSQTIDRQLAAQPASSAASSAAKLQSTTLVFRDGHHEEVADYTISSGILYASSDYYTSGAWNQKIELASLNVAETIASNQARGVQFRLPSAPNVVIVGP